MSATRDSEGYPLQGYDTVPAKPSSKQHLFCVMRLLQEANTRNDLLGQQLIKWKKDYKALHGDYLALKYGQLCKDCQLKHLTAPEGRTLEVTCADCNQGQIGTAKLLEQAETRCRYWQSCYETLLEQHYGTRSDDGTDKGLR